MNLTPWILFIVIALCMALTEQMHGGSSSNVDNRRKELTVDTGEIQRKTCLRWILDDQFSDNPDEFGTNLIRAEHLRRTMYLTRPEICEVNIWTRGYSLTLLQRAETNNTDLMPIAYCSMLSPHPWQKITPQGPKFTCQEWLLIGGFSVTNPENNRDIARNQTNARVVPFVSRCVIDFVTLLLSEHDIILERPFAFCHDHLRIATYKTLVEFTTCRP